MKKTENTNLFKILGHPQRYEILRRLMATPSTLTQLGEAFGKSPAHIRHHLKILEQAGLAEFVEARPVQGGPEKYYRATQRALIIHQTVLPEAARDQSGITVGSMDPELKRLVSLAGQQKAPVSLLTLPLSSLDGLIALRQKLCQMSTCHLVDRESGEYNRPFVRHIFPGQPVALAYLYQRIEGLLVKPGNPLDIRSAGDLARPDVRMINREPGSGVRQWLDLQFIRLGVETGRINGYGEAVHSHASVARAIASGRADAGIGVPVSARTFGLDFIPLFEEPYELVTPAENLADARFTAFFEVISSAEFRSAVRETEGYEVPQTAGKVEIVR